MTDPSTIPAAIRIILRSGPIQTLQLRRELSRMLGREFSLLEINAELRALSDLGETLTIPTGNGWTHSLRTKGK